MRAWLRSHRWHCLGVVLILALAWVLWPIADTWRYVAALLLVTALLQVALARGRTGEG